MKASHMTFGVDRRGSAIVTCAMVQRPGQDHPSGFALHFPLDLLAPAGGEHACRALGTMSLGFLVCYHPDAMQPYVFRPITFTSMLNPIGDLDLMVREHGLILPIHVALGLTEDGRSLELSERDDAHQALPGTLRSTPLRELEERGPDGAATHVGNDVLDTLMRLYPAVFAQYPQLAKL